MSRIRVLQLTFDFQVEAAGGGVSRFAMDLVHALDRDRFEPAICGLWNWGTELEEQHIQQLNADGIQAFSGAAWDGEHPYASFRRAQATLLAYLSEHPNRLVHSHSEFSDVAALLAKFRRRAPVILRSVHYGYQYEWRKRPLRRLLLTNLLYPLFYDQEIGISQDIQARLDARPIARLFRKKSLYLNNAINLERFARQTNDKPDLRQKLGLSRDRLIAGSAGRLSEQKDYRTFVRAAAVVMQTNPEITFILIGDGEQRQELEKLAAELGLEGNFSFLGRKQEIEDYLAALDVFVSSSLWEGLPTVILESMASGIPVVATDIPGTRDLIKPGVNGWLAPAGNAEALAQKIIEALQSPQRRESYAERNRTTASRFSIKAVAEQHAQLYERLASKQAGGG